MKCLYGIGSILGILLLGGYLSATFRYNDSIDLYRWISVILYILLFGGLFISELKKESE